MIVVVCPYCGLIDVEYDEKTHTITCNDCEKTFFHNLKLANLDDIT